MRKKRQLKHLFYGGFMREELIRDLDSCQVSRSELYNRLFIIEKEIMNSYHYSTKDYEFFFLSTTHRLLKEKEEIIRKIKILNAAIENLRRYMNVCK